MINMTSLKRTLPSDEELRQFYVGQDVTAVPKPAIILDIAKVRRHASAMLDAAKSLGVGFRAHVKTHKTQQVTRLQVGESSEQARFVVSTVSELEFMLPVFEDIQKANRQVNILYGIPIPPSQIPRVAKSAARLGSGSISFMVDHPSQIQSLQKFHELTGFPAQVFLKVDTGYHRAGLPPSGLNKQGLIQETAKLEAEGKAVLIGLYSHSSLSYADSTSTQAMDNLAGEIDGCLEAVERNVSLFTSGKKLTVSVGASPQVTSIQNFAHSGADLAGISDNLRASLQRVKSGSIQGVDIDLELHAGVYSTLDIQQLATNSRRAAGTYDDEIAIAVAAEVVSVYNDGERKQPEALIAVGVLGLGREPCHAYPGWGILSQRSYTDKEGSERRLIVERISQEHAIVAWDKKDSPSPIPLEVGGSVLIFPNHACIAGALYDWYLVVDSSKKGEETKIIDVYTRASGW